MDAAERTQDEGARQSAYRLRAAIRGLSPSERERHCGVWCVEHANTEPAIQVIHDGAPRARWNGLLTCGHIWTCPVCSQSLRAQRAEAIVRAVKHLAGRWQMLTVTLRHRQGMNLRDLRNGLMAAWRKTRQGGRIQRVWGELVTASVRTQEVTYGDNGWHPHLHVLLRTEEWSDDDKDALQVRWEKAIVGELGSNVRPDDLHGVVWSEPWDVERITKSESKRATYLAKLGLESASLGKEGRRGSRTPWDLARMAANGDQRARWLWCEYTEATRGRRMIELDDRAAAAAKRALELEAAETESSGGEPREPQRIEVARDDVRALRYLERRGHPGIMGMLLRLAETEGEPAVRQWIAYARSRVPERQDFWPAFWSSVRGPPSG